MWTLIDKVKCGFVFLIFCFFSTGIDDAAKTEGYLVIDFRSVSTNKSQNVESWNSILFQSAMEGFLLFSIDKSMSLSSLIENGICCLSGTDVHQLLILDSCYEIKQHTDPTVERKSPWVVNISPPAWFTFGRVPYVSLK